jgi:hypothetical protein
MPEVLAGKRIDGDLSVIHLIQVRLVNIVRPAAPATVRQHAFALCVSPDHVWERGIHRLT